MKLNLGSGKVRKEGFVSVDKFPMPEVDIAMDLFAYPWDFKDNTVDEFHMSHIVEHIPHEPKRSKVKRYSENLRYEDWKNDAEQWAKRWEEIRNYDGFFCWFAETWRIAKPGAKVRIICPYGMSYAAFQDPTHTRYIVQPSFAYLTAEAQQSINWDYHLPFLYKIEQCSVSIHPAFTKDGANTNLDNDTSQLDLSNTLFHQWNIGYEIEAVLKVIKCPVCGGKHEEHGNQGSS